MDQVRQPTYKKIKSSAEGNCSICGNFSRLTFDHIPPKACYKEEAVFIAEYLSREKKTISQNGTKFRSLCGNCNNTLLGTYYDPSLIDFVGQVKKEVVCRENSSLYLPNKISVAVDILRISKAIVGHTLACEFAKNYPPEYFSMPFYKDMIDFVLEQNKRTLDHYDIYYWYYPYSHQKMLRGYSLMKYGSPQVLLGHIIKFFSGRVLACL